MKTNDGGPAFPGVQTVTFEERGCNISDPDARVESFGGMSLRAWLAGQALCGLCASRTMLDIASGEAVLNEKPGFIYTSLPQRAVLMADGVLFELNKDNDPPQNPV